MQLCRHWGKRTHYFNAYFGMYLCLLILITKLLRNGPKQVVQCLQYLLYYHSSYIRDLCYTKCIRQRMQFFFQANVFCWNISLSTNLLFMKNDYSYLFVAYSSQQYTNYTYHQYQVNYCNIVTTIYIVCRYVVWCYRICKWFIVCANVSSRPVLVRKWLFF